MKRYAHLTVVGPAEHIRSLDGTLALEGSRIITPRRDDSRGKLVWWSPRYEFSDPHDDVDGFFALYGEKLLGVTAFPPGAIDIYLSLVAEGGPPDDETPGGHYLSSSAVAWLAKLGAAVDIDVIWRL